MPTDTLPTIDPNELSRVSGGTTSNDQITAILSQITTSLSSLSANKNQTDPTEMMLLMMMMGGFGGGGGGVVAAGAPVAASPPVVNVDTSVLSRGGFGWLGGGGCRGGGSKKGW